MGILSMITYSCISGLLRNVFQLVSSPLHLTSYSSFVVVVVVLPLWNNGQVWDLTIKSLIVNRPVLVCHRSYSFSLDDIYDQHLNCDNYKALQ